MSWERLEKDLHAIGQKHREAKAHAKATREVIARAIEQARQEAEDKGTEESKE